MAGHIRASIGAVPGAADQHQGTARVLAITRQGWRLLRNFPAS
jgi:hypothetical protein